MKLSRFKDFFKRKKIPYTYNINGINCDIRSKIWKEEDVKKIGILIDSLSKKWFLVYNEITFYSRLEINMDGSTTTLYNSGLNNDKKWFKFRLSDCDETGKIPDDIKESIIKDVEKLFNVVVKKSSVDSIYVCMNIPFKI